MILFIGKVSPCLNFLLRSDVFMAMLSSGTWTEGNKSHLIILDFEPTAVKGMLHFAYTGELSNDIQDHLA